MSQRTPSTVLGLCAALACWSAAADGQLVIGEPFPMDEPVEATGGGPFVNPEVAGSDHGFLAISGGYATRLDPDDGALLDPDGHLLLPIWEDLDMSPQSISLSSNGATYLLLMVTGEWEDGEHHLATLLLDAATCDRIGEVVYIAPCGGSGIGALAVAAADGGDYLVAWREDGLRGARLDGGTGEALDPPEGFQILDGSHGVGELAVAAGGAGFLVAWEEYGGADGGEIRAARVGEGGAVLDPGGMLVAQDVGYVGAVRAAGTASAFVVAWSDYELEIRVRAARVTGAGTVGAAIDAYTLPQGRYLTSVSAAASGDEALLAWSEEDDYSSDDPYGTSDVLGVLVDAASDLAVSGPLEICAHLEQQEAEAVAASGGIYLATWQDRRNDAWHVYGARVGEGGAADPDGIAIFTAPNDQGSPACAGFEEGYLVAWSDSRNGSQTGTDLYGARIQPGGGSLDAHGIEIKTSGAYDVASGILATGGDAFVFPVSLDEATGQASVGASRVDFGAGEVIPGNELAIGAALGDMPEIVPLDVDGTVLLPYAIDDRIQALALDWTDGLVSLGGVLREAPAPEEEGQVCELGELAAAAIGDVVLIAWREGCYHPGTEKGYFDDVLAQRFELVAGPALEPVGDLMILEAQWRDMSLIALEDGFLVLAARSNGDGAAVVGVSIPADWTAPAGPEEPVLEPPHDVTRLSTAVFDGGILVAMIGYVPLPDVDGSVQALFLAVVDPDLGLVAGPQQIDGVAGAGALAARGDEVLMVSQSPVDGSSRLAGRIVRVDDAGEPDDPPDGSDAGADPGLGVGAITSRCACEVAGRTGSSLLARIASALLDSWKHTSPPERGE